MSFRVGFRECESGSISADYRLQPSGSGLTSSTTDGLINRSLSDLDETKSSWQSSTVSDGGTPRSGSTSPSDTNLSPREREGKESPVTSPKNSGKESVPCTPGPKSSGGGSGSIGGQSTEEVQGRNAPGVSHEASPRSSNHCPLSPESLRIIIEGTTPPNFQVLFDFTRTTLEEYESSATSVSTLSPVDMSIIKEEFSKQMILQVWLKQNFDEVTSTVLRRENNENPDQGSRAIKTVEWSVNKENNISAVFVEHLESMKEIDQVEELKNVTRINSIMDWLLKAYILRMRQLLEGSPSNGPLSTSDRSRSSKKRVSNKRWN